MVAKITELEENLRDMDDEFEHQTAKIKKRYDATLRNKIEDVTKKVKQDYQFSFDIKMKEERSNMLKEKLDFIDSFGGEKTKLSSLRLQQEKMKGVNRDLEKALEDSEAELQKLKGLSKKGWWPF